MILKLNRFGDKEISVPKARIRSWELIGPAGTNLSGYGAGQTLVILDTFTLEGQPDCEVVTQSPAEIEELFKSC